MRNLPIIALDFPGIKETKDFLSKFQTEKLFVKVGMELYYQSGPAIIEFLKENNHQVFLDLKLHDIPNTVKSAMKVLAGLEVDMTNVHAAGGQRMMEAAWEGLNSGTLSGKKRPTCIAVTQLTSTSTSQMNKEQLIEGELERSVLHYARLAKQSGLDGVVCSPLEVSDIHTALGTNFLTVTPGIRMANGNAHDQIRIATPEKARDLGSNFIVVGRAITGAEDPLSAYQTIKQAWEGIEDVK
ncbi:orotidine-5'-phosphate decarboxylase [Peribacillus huizhouensis]|uniref:Orotidine 5'-phosphate decarboxylase n=1 Tax=Peribacillus huizhouensis TaxID=1501239 RepID=A0ABR6CIW6_9BACI|nr:orotidine-5'-phosphate decarboxylase [Peribacillus huizhouensis]MBA9024933.1 orotidine-5'-phosphate decarboxylase [Peribacillus huizhouensis]